MICGHIHHAVISNLGGMRYMNTGDWVESCTALAENFDGSFELIHWAQAEEAAPTVLVPIAFDARLSRAA